MAEHTRKDPRAKVLSMTVRYKSATLDEFIEHHSHDVSRGGMYIKTPQPFPPGTLLKFEVKIAADQKLMQGVGRVVWRRESDEASADHPAGMGVKFIKLDEESKDIIDQLVTARMGDISAFDEVAPDAESARGGPSEPPGAAESSGADGFFPKSPGHVQQPAPEDRTVMKQATELLQEALREVGGGSPSESSMKSAAEDVIPKAPRAASVGSASGATRPLVPPQHQEQTPRYQRIPTPVAASSRAEIRGSTSEPSKPKTSDPARPASFEPSAPSATNQPTISDAPKTVPATPMGARRAVPAEPAEVPSAAEDKPATLRAKAPNRGVRIGVTLVLVGGVAAGVFALTRKQAPPAPEPTPTPSASQTIESAPVVLNVTGGSVDAATPPSQAPSASAAPSEAPAASAAPAPSQEPSAASEKPAVQEAPKAEAASKVRVPVRRKKADAGTASPPPLDTADELYPTPAPAPAKTGSDSQGSSEAPAPTATSKSKGKSAAPAPAPTPTEEPSP